MTPTRLDEERALSSTYGVPPAAGPPADLTIDGLVAPFVGGWRRIALGSIAGGLLLFALSWLVPNKYTTATTFIPEAGTSSPLAGALGSLGALAGSVGGLSGALGSSAQPELFASLLGSRELREAALGSMFAHEGAKRTLLDILEVTGDTPEERMGDGLRRFEKLTGTAVDKKTGIVTLTVTMRDPVVAADVANRMTQLLNEFNLRRRQSSSRAQREFSERRLAQAEGELRAAEARQLSFAQSNRLISQSPSLQVAAARLDREVRLKQEVVMNLTKAVEDSRIAEVRDTPVLTVIDRAVPPDRKSSPRRALLGAIGVALGLLASAAFVFVSAVRRSPENVPAA